MEALGTTNVRGANLFLGVQLHAAHTLHPTSRAQTSTSYNKRGTV